MVVAASTIRPAAASVMPVEDGRLDADALDQLLREPGAGDDPEGHGQEREAGLQRRVAEDLLHVERGEEEHPEEAADDDEEDGVGGGQRADAEDPEAHERGDRAALDEPRRRPGARWRRR